MVVVGNVISTLVSTGVEPSNQPIRLIFDVIIGPIVCPLKLAN